MLARRSTVNRSLIVAGVLLISGLLTVGGCPGFSLNQLLGNCDNQTGDPNCNCDPNTGGQDPNSGDTTARTLHETIFEDLLDAGFTGPADCMLCHADEALDLMDHGHWSWRGTVANIEGLEGETHGKWDLINNFCVAVPSNEGRCTQCHPGFDWKSTATDLTDIDLVDCLICHDTTGTYVKHPSANGGGGPPAFKVDGAFVLATTEELAELAGKVGTPTRKSCGFCHFNAGGGDNVKHGDLASTLVNATFEVDVHMDMDGLNFTCQQCHTNEEHGFSGMPLHSVDDGGLAADCARCHTDSPHEANGTVASILNTHTDRIACQTCHIPAFARQKPTKVEWYWSEAGQDLETIPTDEYGMALYDKMKGRFVYDKNVVPTLKWFDGNWQRKVINATDTYTEAGTAADPVVLATPTADINTMGAKIYPFKKMIGDQPVDPINKRVLVPHLFGTAGGENPYWGKYDWGLALADGTAYAGQEYSGTYDFANTEAYLTVNHEIAPAEDALTCGNCHGNDGFFTALGYDGDPLGQ
jgi:octaheme c-type cytochrome (tetrathionate reductase family)